LRHLRDQDLPPARFLTCPPLRRRHRVSHIKGLRSSRDHPRRQAEHEKTNFGGIWHSDTSYLETPPMATMLIAREVPARGGDTMFANTYAAYETLSDGMKRLLDGVIAINTSALADVSRTREDRVKEMKREDAKKDTGEHRSCARIETGRKALYINVGHTLRFKDMTVEESAPILRYLFQHQTRPEFTCRFTWKVGSLAFWDNRCALHNPVNDYHGYRRVMHRITLAGDKPR
jgi:taurine dioxygenase